VAARAAAKAAKAAPASAVECADDVAVVEAPTQLAGVLYSFSIASSGVGETAEPDAPCEPAPEDPLGTTTAADAGSDPTHEEGSTAVPAGVRSPFRGTSPVPE
jgi:hypothetical protein